MEPVTTNRIQRKSWGAPGLALNCVCISHFIINSKILQESDDDSSRNQRKQSINNGVNADIVFVVGTQKHRIPSYKQVLSLSNEVLKVQFQADFKDKSAKEIFIPDLDPKAFQLFLQFLYFGEFELDDNAQSLDMALKVYEIGHRYLAKQLKQVCAKFLTQMIDHRNVFSLMMWNQLYNDPIIYKVTTEFFQKNTISCLIHNSGGFAKLSKALVLKIVLMDQMNCSEKLLVSSIMHWARTACLQAKKPINSTTIREEIADFLPHIRLKLNKQLRSNTLLPENPRQCSFVRPDLQRMQMMEDVAKLEQIFYYREKIISFGCTVLLSNLKHKPSYQEEIYVTITKDEEVLKKLKLFTPVSEYITTKEILFDQPIIFDPGDEQNYKITVEYAAIGNRMVAHDSDTSDTGFTVFLFEDRHNPLVHSVFESTKKDQLPTN